MTTRMSLPHLHITILTATMPPTPIEHRTFTDCGTPERNDQFAARLAAAVGEERGEETTWEYCKEN